MAKTIGNLRSVTRTTLDESAADDWTAAEVDFEINIAYHEVIAAVMDIFEQYYVIKASFNSVANQQEYGTADSVPTDIQKLERVEINYDPGTSGSVASRALPVEMEEITTNLASTVIGSTITGSAAYYLYGQGTGSSGIKIGFIPIPDETGTNAISIWYVQAQSDLSDSNTSVNIPYADNYFKIICKRAAARLLRKGQQEEAVAAKYLEESDVDLSKMKQQLEDRVSDGSKRVVDTVHQDVDFSSFY